MTLMRLVWPMEDHECLLPQNLQALTERPTRLTMSERKTELVRLEKAHESTDRMLMAPPVVQSLFLALVSFAGIN